MRKFKVLHCKQTRMLKQVKSGKRDDGSVYAYAVFSEIQAGEKDHAGNVWYPGAYGHEKIKAGDIIELQGFRADKAANNPQFEEVFDVPKKRGPGRPRKVKAEGATA